MIKPRKNRSVLYPPGFTYFKPQGVAMENLDEVSLTVDEYEAIRLSDYENLKHEEASIKMKISRPTFTRLVNTARNKVARALVSGSAIKIQGGSYVFLKNRLKCNACGSMWETKYRDSEKLNCPECKSENINYADRNFQPTSFKKRFRGGRG